MRYLHTMVRVENLERSLDFYCKVFGLEEVSRKDNEKGRFTLVFLAAPADAGKARTERAPELELTHNWDAETYGLMAAGITVNRPPRDGAMAFVRSPDNISIELLQKGGAKAPAEPWASMGNTGVW